MTERPRLVTSAVAARELGVDPSTPRRWVKEGKVTPTYITPGGQYRWDITDLRNQLRSSAEQRALDPGRSWWAAIQHVLADIDSPHQALSLIAQVLALLQAITDDVVQRRTTLVRDLADDQAQALAPLAHDVDMSAARAAQRKGRK